MFFLAVSFSDCEGQTSGPFTKTVSPAGWEKWTGSSVGELAKAAQSGDPNARYYLGWKYYQGDGVSPDHDIALRWLRQAADQGVLEAQLKLGVLEEMGIGRPVNTQAALEWYIKSATGSNAVAQYKAGMLYLATTTRSNYYQQGTNWLQLGAEAGYGPAQFAWAYQYEKIPRIAPVNGGTTNGQMQVDVSERFYRAAAEQGMADAQYKLSQMYLQKDGQNMVESYKWLLLAVAQEHATAASFLRHFGKHPELRGGGGRGYTEEEIKEGTKLLASFKSKDLPFVWRHNEEVRYFFPSDKIPGSPSFVQLEAAATKGDAEAQFLLGVYYQHEPLRVPPTFIPLDSSNEPLGLPLKPRREMAAEWLEKAAKQGHPDAQLNLALIYLNRPVKEQNRSEAKRWLMMAAQQRAEAQYQLARFLELQQEAPDVSLAEIFKYYRLSAEQGHPLARTRLQALSGQMFNSEPMAITVQSDDVKSVNQGRLKLGIVVSGDSLAAAADLLTVTLSKLPGIEVLERSEVDRIFKEQALSRNQSSALLKLGQLLSADGLIQLEKASPPFTNSFLMRTMAVKPGVIISEHWHPADAAALSDWNLMAIRQLRKSFAKMRVVESDAIPLSVLNLRAAVVTPESPEKESQLTWLLTRRLVQQPEFFVLERERLEKLAEDAALSASATAFWNGSYTLEGVIDRDQVTPGFTTVDVRLSSPKMMRKEFRVSGPTAQMPQMVERIMTNITAVLAVKSGPAVALNPVEEASTYYDEAQWALRWQLFPEAQRASEASWALGLRMPELATIRLRSYLDPRAISISQEYALATVRRGLELAQLHLRPLVTRHELDQPLAGAAIGVLEQASNYLVHEADKPTDTAKLGRLREQIRELADLLGEMPESWRVVPGSCLPRLTVQHAVRWEDDFAGSKKRLEALIDRGGFHDVIEHPVYDQDYTFKPFTWKSAEKDDIAELLYQWVVGLTHQTGHARPEAGYYHLLNKTRSDYEFEDRMLAFVAFARQNREALARDQISAKIWEIVEQRLNRFATLSPVLDRLRKEEFPSAESFIREAMQENAVSVIALKLKAAVGDKKDGWKAVLALAPYPEMNQQQAQMLEPLLTEFESKTGKGVFLHSLREKVNLALNKSATTAKTAAKPYVSGPPPVADFPYRSNLVTSVPGLLLLPAPWEQFGLNSASIIPQGVDDRFAWFEMRIRSRGALDSTLISLSRVDLESLSAVSIPLPAVCQARQDGQPLLERAFLSHQGEMYLLLTNRLLRLDATLKSWQDTGLALPSTGRLFSIASRMVAVTATSVLHIDPAKKSVAVLASSRRRPAANIMDQVESLDTAGFFTGAEGNLCVQLGGHVYTYVWQTGNWNEVTGMPDLAQWSLLPGRNGVIYQSRLSGGVALMGWTFIEPKPFSCLGVFSQDIGLSRLPLPPLRPSDTRWMIPNELAKLHMDSMGDGSSARPAAANWDDGKLWAVFSKQMRQRRSLSQWQNLREHPPYVMIATIPGIEPLVCPVKLIEPENPSGVPFDFVKAVEYSGISSALTSRYLVLVATDIPALWAIPRSQFDGFLAAQSKQPVLARNQRWLELQRRQEQWGKIFDRNNDGELNAMESAMMTNHPIYRRDQVELKSLENENKDGR